ncbi:hypothetical protein ACCO45_002548 [Purpureocillium lilacinum]|uniref:Uncharacterized protein n=1 Tax=Purpureocillium lilacinum TaxID=33203 RepID=A0ACC4EBD1_PURLI
MANAIAAHVELEVYPGQNKCDSSTLCLRSFLFQGLWEWMLHFHLGSIRWIDAISQKGLAARLRMNALSSSPTKVSSTEVLLDHGKMPQFARVLK